MSKEPAAEMNANIVRRVRYSALFFTGGLLVFAWIDPILVVLERVTADNRAEADVATSAIRSVVIGLGMLVTFALDLGRNINLHGSIDKRFVKARARVGTLIQNELAAAGERLRASGASRIRGDKSKAMQLFYFFVNREEATRSLAFTRWESYFVNIYVTMVGALSTMGAIVVAVTRGKLDVFSFAFPGVLAAITFVIGWHTKTSLIPSLLSLPLQQIADIEAAKGADLKAQIESRFGSGVYAP